MKRKEIAEIYSRELSDVKGIRMLEDMPEVSHNYGYFPIFINEKEYGKSRDQLYNELRSNNIYTRRYFYPLISQFPTYKGLESAKAQNLPIAEKITRQILCLPIYSDISSIDVRKIMKTILEPV